MANLLRCAIPAVLVIGVVPAHASFVFETPPADAGPEFVSPSQIDTPGLPSVANSAGPTHWKMAYGFGNGVPLNFACRQIVPPAVKVTFGPGVNPAVPVSWKGGDTWNHVLRDTLKPLGLHLEMSYMAVAIEK